ncbi:MAG: DUF3153 domain-containing protein [Gloeomargaritaceae cyanobacterium C42_A2020_066]|nr:DUF3153 domain-containing protein [Gloeomargaritaceae cyanobacterium C42_A2020_066]
MGTGRRFLQQCLVWVWIGVVAFGLGGCVQYDLAAQFNWRGRGEWVQQVTLSEPLVRFGGPAVQSWIEGLQGRTRQLGGQVTRPAERVLELRLPFADPQELATSLATFFQDPEAESPAGRVVWVQTPWGLVTQNRLTYDLDLRPLATWLAQGEVVEAPETWVDLTFRVLAPWGVQPGPETSPAAQRLGDGVAWTLQPGQVYHLEAVFWLPDPVGLAALMTAILVALGLWLRQRLGLPQPQWPRLSA